MMWPFPKSSPTEDLNEARREALADVRDMRANFEAVLRRAATSDDPVKIDVSSIVQEFARIEEQIAQATDTHLEELEERAERLERLRAYVFPVKEISIEGAYLMSVLGQWGVPAPVLRELQNNVVVPLTSDKVEVSRGALHTLLRDYDFWSTYVDEFATFMERVARWLLGLEIVLLLSALWRFIAGDVIFGFVLAGACGAITSVLSKMPSMMVDAENDAYLRRILMRVGTGVAAASIGVGFLASGFFTIAMPMGDQVIQVPKLIEDCARGKVGTPGSCSVGGLLFLLGLGIVLGFSERVLTTLEDKVFPTPQSATVNPSPKS